MLKIIKIEKSAYTALSEPEKTSGDAIFLCKDSTTGLCSIYVDGFCYGEDIDEENIDNRLDSVEEQLQRYDIANNYDILNILNS